MFSEYKGAGEQPHRRLNANGVSTRTARAVRAEAAVSGRQMLGASHQDTVAALSLMATLQHERGKMEDAVLLYDEALKGSRTSFGEGHERTRDIGARHASSLLVRSLLDERRLRLQRHVVGRIGLGVPCVASCAGGALSASVCAASQPSGSDGALTTHRSPTHAANHLQLAITHLRIQNCVPLPLREKVRKKMQACRLRKMKFAMTTWMPALFCVLRLPSA